ncbi:IMPACT family protein [Stackebrandtia nassauensis]|uniref:Impact N-terminal domain-containing protein n=1 Tax=Stackebrandtia nassauensis (strain DSM 44728 / CIP 108903 / NRRL B-16338 / NBRC 102104 / LLR-40K-21) TaxID=446470 RepID=D3QBH3_STANL|nr:YigZ family protein [Stackebrandtia nassauensis]ADD42855.1 protein of unknown function UPF0029 [Stackebrandtia nassauensis DSM 44728]
MRTITRDATAEITVHRSRFICALARLDSETDAKAFIAGRRKLHHAARHHATAWILGPDAANRRSSDDGEPAGTAGAPMLSILAGRDLTDTVAVVTRYFGGVKLGTGGLARAYGDAVTAALDTTGTVERVAAETFTITCPHDVAGRLDAELRAAGHTITATRYDTAAHIDVVTTDTHTLTTWLTTRGLAALHTGTTVIDA